MTRPHIYKPALVNAVNEIVADYLHNDKHHNIPLNEGLNMKKCDFLISNELITNAKDEEEFAEIFNEKIATLSLLYEKILGLK